MEDVLRMCRVCVEDVRIFVLFYFGGDVEGWWWLFGGARLALAR